MSLNYYHQLVFHDFGSKMASLFLHHAIYRYKYNTEYKVY